MASGRAFEVIILLICALALIFFLGDQSGREATERTKQQREIIEQKAKLKSMQARYYGELTPSWLYLLAIVLVAFVLASMGGRCQPDDNYRHYHRHTCLPDRSGPEQPV